MLTKKQTLKYYNIYKTQSKKGLYDCYAKPSEIKKVIYKDCISIMFEDDGYNSTILTYNAQVFTFAYLYDRINYNTKTKTMHFKVITKNHIGDIIIEEESI